MIGFMIFAMMIATHDTYEGCKVTFYEHLYCNSPSWPNEKWQCHDPSDTAGGYGPFDQGGYPDVGAINIPRNVISSVFVETNGERCVLFLFSELNFGGDYYWVWSDYDFGIDELYSPQYAPNLDLNNRVRSFILNNKGIHPYDGYIGNVKTFNFYMMILVVILVATDIGLLCCVLRSKKNNNPYSKSFHDEI